MQHIKPLSRNNKDCRSMGHEGKKSGYGMFLRRAFAPPLVVIAIGGPPPAGNGFGKGGGNDYSRDKGGNVPAPEIDLGVLPGALMLLAGGTMILVDRVRRTQDFRCHRPARDGEGHAARHTR